MADEKDGFIVLDGRYACEPKAPYTFNTNRWGKVTLIYCGLCYRHVDFQLEDGRDIRADDPDMIRAAIREIPAEGLHTKVVDELHRQLAVLERSANHLEVRK